MRPEELNEYITNDELRKLADQFGWELGTGTDNGVEVDVLWLRPLEYGVTASELFSWFGDFLAAMIAFERTPHIELHASGIDVGWQASDGEYLFVHEINDPNEIMPALVRSAIDMFESEGWKND